MYLFKTKDFLIIKGQNCGKNCGYVYKGQNNK